MRVAGLVKIPDAFAKIAVALSNAGLGSFVDAFAEWPGVPVVDDGGSIVSPGEPISRPCKVQVDRVTEAMRQAEGYRDKDVALLVLCATLEGELDTDATLNVTAGPNAGRWSVQSVDKDTMGTYWLCRGRRA